MQAVQEVQKVQVGDTVLFVPPVQSWSRWLKFRVNTKYYSIGKLQAVDGEFATVVDVTGQQFMVFTHQVVLLTETA